MVSQQKGESSEKTADLQQDEGENGTDDTPSMTISLFVFFVIPALLFSVFSRLAVDTTVKPIELKGYEPLNFERRKPPEWQRRPVEDASSPVPAPTPLESAPSSWPTAYQHVLSTIQSRRRRIEIDQESAAPQQRPAPSTTQDAKSNEQSQTKNREKGGASRRGGVNDDIRLRLIEQISVLEETYRKSPNDLFAALDYADAMRMYELRYHEGGTYENQTIQMFEKIVDMALDRKNEAVQNGQSTRKANDPSISSVKNEISLDYRAKSIDGLLCAIYTAQGKSYFMANMFERAVESYSSCLEIEPGYLDAVNSRGSALLILGRYTEAARDLVQVTREDDTLGFSDAFQGLARILQTQEDTVVGGWDALVEPVEDLIPKLEGLVSSVQNKQAYATVLSRLHHSLFLYHDSKTKDSSAAFEHLQTAYKNKMSLLPPWQKGSELARIRQTKSIFTSGFWPSYVGSETRIPIFIVGFVRSGSTLLERVLDSHPQIVGTGENSVFNGRLPEIRNEIVRVSMESPERLGDVTRQLADGVVLEMQQRWEALKQANGDEEADKEPARFVDKMLTNYYSAYTVLFAFADWLSIQTSLFSLPSLFLFG